MCPKRDSNDKVLAIRRTLILRANAFLLQCLEIEGISQNLNTAQKDRLNYTHVNFLLPSLEPSVLFINIIKQNREQF